MNNNNELNAIFHRQAVMEMFETFKKVADQMNAMLELPSWHSNDERDYDRLANKRHAAVMSLKREGMFL